MFYFRKRPLVHILRETLIVGKPHPKSSHSFPIDLEDRNAEETVWRVPYVTLLTQENICIS